jgi:hypothetical protein
MNMRRSLFHFTAGRGESSARAVGSIRLGAIALLGVAVLAVATVQSCRAARNNDGSITISFAPDMTITAWGLEDALKQLQDLYRQCLAGTWQRPCTPDEIAGIERMHAKVLEVKARLNHD